MKRALPFTVTYVDAGTVIQERDKVEFRLLYEGNLTPLARAPEKHAIRRSFHPQLRRLWQTNPNLRKLAEHSGRKAYADQVNEQRVPSIAQLSDDDAIQNGFSAMGANWNIAGYNLVPLATFDMALQCSINILILRPEDDRYIMNRGDVDGQVKTLFDALRIPNKLDEVGGAPPQSDETPFFCLLEDDRLISELHVTADKLLLLPQERQVKENDAFVVIHVRLNHRNPPFP